MAANDELKSLHTALIDARQGYIEAEADADTADMKALFGRMASLHDDAQEAIHEFLLEMGEKPNDDGSFMGTVHRTVISMRAAVTGLDRNSLSSFASGEERIIKAYDDAIAEQASNVSLRAMLEHHRSNLMRELSEMRRKAA
jgi:uncharacterized protein (TIGR02284 family)